ncbi:MAG: DUF389 domain-containing protein [Chloroflexi bacterium]|nr:DUF389 domain-containing protein [Chloroflexota bacterium]
MWGLLPQVETSVRREVLGSLFFTGPALRPYLIRFTVLLALSVTIASYGLLGDSAAVVIGAMLVAPLMTPVLGVAAALVMGWPRRLTLSALQVAAATAGSIALAWLLTVWVPSGVFALIPSEQLLARTEPSVLDLGIALAAGAAGAYVLVHKEEVSALPGVAVAVALVPPLSVVGISLQAGEYADAGGAFVLYLTNLAGIVLAAMVVFFLTGFVPVRHLRRMFGRIQLGFIIAACAVLVISVPLIYNSRLLLSTALDEGIVRQEIDDWLGDETTLELVALDVSGDRVDLDLLGPEPPPPATALRIELADALGEDVTVKVGWIENVEQLAAPEP